MTVYPSDIDDDSTIIRVDDNITELGSTAISQIRDAIFAIEAELGINPAGSAGSVVNRLNKSLTADGDIKAAALSAVGLVTLPITNNQVATTAGIEESKLSLSFSTSDLNTRIVAAQALIDSATTLLTKTSTDLLSHIGGATFLSDGATAGRHVASHVDLNAVPSDSRDTTFIWSGIIDKDGNQRSATNMAEGLAQVNDALTNHENLVTQAHPASSITVDTTNFVEISQDADTVQKALDDIDDSETLKIGLHRAIMHSNGVPRTARSNVKNLDGYSQNIVPATTIKAYLVRSPATSPVDNNVNGDDLIQFFPDNTGFVFDSQFTQVKPGDIVTINYGNGVEAKFPIESIRFLPNTEWFVRINGVNLFNTDGYTAFARIDRPLFDPSTQGVLAVAAANSDIDPSLKSSLIVANPRSASVVGIGFDPNHLDSSHFNLYLQLYPTGNPTDRVITLPAIDVTGNAGITPGQYTLSTIIQNTNDALRAGGFNYRFIAFAHKGEFGIMLADPINQASFSIVSGEISGSSLVTGSFINNVIGDAVDSLDALGLGAAKAAAASPAFVSTFPSTEAATDLPIKVFAPLKNRNYIANGVRRDNFASTFMANVDGYWAATLTGRTLVGTSTVEVTYEVPIRLDQAELQPGKTIVVQPAVDFDDPSYSDADYGRFIIKEVTFVDACSSPLTAAATVITVVNGVHASGDPISFSSPPELPVHLYFSEDSVSFNSLNVIDPTGTGTTYNRLFEIYVTGEGNTFTHERARMPKQSETTDLLDTVSLWTIKDVSPKLRGFRDDSSSNLNRFVRLYILSYNSTTGEFDGYIGKRTAGSPVISNTGVVTTGRKNVPVRFYDETNIDYIEIEFFDNTISPGSDIMSTDAPRYVDIEIFPSIRNDDQFFLLATCEVENTGTSINVECVTDRREFGNVSEQNFTNSAIDFITAGDRHLHENGIVRGLDIVGVDPSDSSLIQFNGGIALVNGRIVTVNHSSVRIPEIREDGASLPATVDWAICVNDTGQFVPIILTSTKEQFFATIGGSNYYVPSVTLNELVTQRKDLTLIATVTATISSIALSTTDARRFVNDTGFGLDFILISDDEQLPGTFNSLTALAFWIKNSNSSRHVVKVRGGDINVGIGTLFTDFNSKEVIFDGTDFARASSSTATFLFDNSTLLTTADNITFKNIDLDFGSSSTVTFGASNKFEDCTINATTNFDVTFNAGCNLLRTTLTASTGNFTFNGGNDIIESTITYSTSATTPSIAGLTKIDRSTISFGTLDATTGLAIGGLSTIDNVIFDSGTAHRCVQLTGGNITFKNCTFTYGPTGLTYSSLHKLNIVSATSTEVACIYRNGSLDNVTIDDCIFNLASGFAGSERPPYIGLVVNRGDVLENIQINKNQFNDNSATGLMSAITVLNRQGGSGSGPIISNSRITHNIGDQEQNIVLTSTLDAFASEIPGLHSVNTVISDNRCGNIGYVVSSDDLYNKGGVRGRSNETSLTIEDNQARIIGNISDSGNFLYADGYDYGGVGNINHDTGNVVISHNSCNWILTSAVSTNYGTEKSGTVLIEGNKLDGYDGAFLTAHGATVLGVPLNIAIVVGGGIPGSDAECRVVNNVTGFGYLSSTQFAYALGNIRTDVSAIINGNTFRGIADDSASAIIMNLNGQQNLVTGNRFFRSSSDVFAYVTAGSTTIEGIITDNFFDSPVNNALDTELVKLSGNVNFVMDRNKNQTFVATINGSTAILGLSSGVSSIYGTTDGAVAQDMRGSIEPGSSGTSTFIRWAYSAASAVRNGAVIIPTDSILPHGAKILNFGCVVKSDAEADSAVGSVTLRLVKGDGTAETLNTPVDLTDAGGYVANTPVATTINIFTPDTKHIVGLNSNAQIIVSFDHSGLANIDISDIFFTYRW